MKYIIITKHAKIVVTEEQKEKFVHNVQTTTSPLLPLKGQLVDRYGIEIYELEFFLKQEADTLKIKNLRRCRHCGEIVSRPDKCGCADNPEIRKNNIFQLEEPKKNNLLT